MRRKINNNYRSILKGVERASKLKDLEIAKELETNINNKQLNTQKIRSDLPKE